MQKNKVLILTAVTIAALGGLGLVSSSQGYAKTESKYPSIVQKLINKFNLNTSEVDKIMEEEKAEREAQRKEMEAKRLQEITDKLTQAVKDGKITEDQKAKILAKFAEMKPNREQERSKEKGDFAKLTQEEWEAKRVERQKEMEQRKAEFEAWEAQLGVKLSDILGSDCFGGPMGAGKGLGGPRGFYGTK